MEVLKHSDIFFAVSTILTTAVGVLVIILLFYVVRIVRDISNVIRIVRRESDHLSEDIATLRSRVHTEGLKIFHLLGLFRRRGSTRKKK